MAGGCASQGPSGRATRRVELGCGIPLTESKVERCLRRNQPKRRAANRCRRSRKAFHLPRRSIFRITLRPRKRSRCRNSFRSIRRRKGSNRFVRTRLGTFARGRRSSGSGRTVAWHVLGLQACREAAVIDLGLAVFDGWKGAALLGSNDLRERPCVIAVDGTGLRRLKPVAPDGLLSALRNRIPM
jgi:hypothetical protein